MANLSPRNIPGSAHLNFSIGGLVILGGAIGYFKKGSTVSLAAGALFGSLFLTSGVMISGDQQYNGHLLAFCTSTGMALGMGQRFLSTQKFMPSGLVALIGAGAAAYNYKKMMMWKRD